ncbi:MAG: hypothetical protein E7E58_01065 [Paeniclostridium sordellii]|nr:hypothetical protein [Paeniclostridium sordellii]
MISLASLDNILSKRPEESWKYISDCVWNIFSQQINETCIENEASLRDSLTNDIESLLATSCSDLWDEFDRCISKTSDEVKSFWSNSSDGKAVLILDGLSMRELPFILQGLESRNYTIDKACITGAELPSHTNSFAKAIGISSRSSLTNNEKSKKSIFNNAYTDCIGLSWDESKEIISSQPNLFIWHEYPDKKVHELDSYGCTIQNLSKNMYSVFSDEKFWEFIKKISTGRDVIITSDHGYAHTGMFMDVTDNDVKDYLKKQYKSARYRKTQNNEQVWVPAIEKSINSNHGDYTFVLNKIKWKVPGGYPTLSHGGLSLLEVMVPFIQFRQEGK